MYKIIGADQKEYGPVSTEQLRQWIVEGRANGQTKVQAVGATEWKAMGDLLEFADVLPKMPAAAPMPAAPMSPPPPPPPRGNNQMAVWAMVTGILSLLCCCGWFVVAPVAIVLGAVALAQLKNHPEMTGHGFAIAGIVLGIVALLMYGAATVVCICNPELLQNLQNYQKSLPQ